jgi:hypothetical protein
MNGKGIERHTNALEDIDQLKLGLEHSIEYGRAVEAGTYKFGDMTVLRLLKYLQKIRTSGIDLGELTTQAEAMVRELPGREMHNHLDRIDALIADGDLAEAKEWHDDTLRVLGSYEQQGLIDASSLEAFRGRLLTQRNVLFPDAAGAVS